MIPTTSRATGFAPEALREIFKRRKLYRTYEGDIGLSYYEGETHVDLIFPNGKRDSFSRKEIFMLKPTKRLIRELGIDFLFTETL